MLSVFSMVFLFGSVTLLLLSISYVLRTQRPRVEPQPNQEPEPDYVWVLWQVEGLEEALASL